MDILEQLQRDIAGYLKSQASSKLAAYQYVNVIVVNPRAITASEGAEMTDIGEMSVIDQINQALAGTLEKGGKNGLAVILKFPDAGVPDEHMAGPFIEIEVEIHVIEHLLFNMGSGGTQVPASTLALDTLCALHNWHPGRTAIPLRGRDKKAIQPVRSDDTNLNIWEVNLFTRYQIVPVRATETPVIAVAGAVVTITCADAGASIKYSIDGSYPTLAYTVPFTVAADCTVRTLAILSPYLPSDIAERDVDI